MRSDTGRWHPTAAKHAVSCEMHSYYVLRAGREATAVSAAAARSRGLSPASLPRLGTPAEAFRWRELAAHAGHGGAFGRFPWNLRSVAEGPQLSIQNK